MFRRRYREGQSGDKDSVLQRCNTDLCINKPGGNYLRAKAYTIAMPPFT
jgi:hypothetical protein